MSDVQTQEFTVKDVNTEKGYIRDINGAYLNLSKFGAKDPQGKKLEIKFFMPGVTYRCAISKSKDGKYSYVQAVISSSASTGSVVAAPVAQVGTTSSTSVSKVGLLDPKELYWKKREENDLKKDIRMSKAGLKQAWAAAAAMSGVPFAEIRERATEQAKLDFNELWNGEQTWS